MKKINFLFVLFVLSSCSASKSIIEERKDWVNEYKDRAFCLCVLKGYEDHPIEKLLIEKDKSFYKPLGIAIFDESLNPIIDNEVKKIKQDSIASIDKYPEDLKLIYQKRSVFDHCLEFYKSKRLADLTKIEQKKWKTIPNTLDKITEKIPTF